MSRETVRMVREGRRPVASPVVVGTELDRDELLARIAVLEEDLAIANRALGRLMTPVMWVYPGADGDGLGWIPWEDDDDDYE